MENKTVKKMLKMVVVVYLVSFFIINWNDVSWIFNYSEVSTLVSDFFNPYPSIDASTIDQYFYPNHSAEISSAQTPVVQEVKEFKTTYTDKQKTLEIPKLSVSVPIIFENTANAAAIHKALDSGVVYYPGSVYPGQVGQIVILGHSAPPGWPKGNNDSFSELEKLSEGDKIYIDLNNKQYTYIVRSKKIIKRGSDVPAENYGNSNILTLISCWPPGKDYQRITVQAELIDG